MSLLFIDLETYATVDLKKTGPYVYAEDPTFEILMAGWSSDGRRFRLAQGEDEIRRIPGLFDPLVTKVAHNAPFERVMLATLDPREDKSPPEEWIDTMALAAEHGYPRSLDALAKALGVQPKDSAGSALISYFCRPYRGRRRFPDVDLDRWRAFCDYCVQDVRTLVEVYRELPPWPTSTERRLWEVDQRINDRGIRVDVEMAEAARAAGLVNRAEQEREVIDLTGVSNANSVQQLGEWIAEQGHRMPDLRAATVAEHVEASTTPEHVREVLALRQEMALAAEKKFTAALLATNEDGRFRGGFQFYGAHTGRWSGRRVQLQNLPREQIPMTADQIDALDALDDKRAREEMAERFRQENEVAAIRDVVLGARIDARVLKALVRAMLIGPFTVVDYSAIEARVLAWLAGEEWLLRAFREGRDVYVEQAARMGERFTRQDGKTAVLALGYQGWITALRVMGATGTDDELAEVAGLYRRTNPAIVDLWAAIERAFWRGGAAGRITVERDGRDRHVVLPSGRALVYRNVRRSRDVYGRPILAFSDPKGFITDTYGGRLTENVTQAVARDVLAEALVRLREWPVVGHVHDEIIVEGIHDVEGLAALMCGPWSWASGLPLSAEGFTCERYRKG